jgi:hypothetical protein
MSKTCGTLLHPPSLVPYLALLIVSWEKKFLPSKKSFLEDGVRTGYFQTCFPVRRPVRRPVFSSKELSQR